MEFRDRRCIRYRIIDELFNQRLELPRNGAPPRRLE
jgi:hypothetical protein